MKRVLSIIFIIVSLITLSGCQNFDLEITTPNVDNMLKGQWIIEKCEDFNGNPVEGIEYNDRIISFNEDEAILFDDLYKNISYKAKVISSKSYIYNILGIVPEYFREKEDITVITLSSKNIFIKDVIIENNKAIIIEEDMIIYLTKSSNNPVENYSKLDNGSLTLSENELKSGVLLGTKTKEENNINYRTFWIYNDGNKIDYKEIPYILLPRKNGFYKVDNIKTTVREGECNKIGTVYLNEVSGEKEDSSMEGVSKDSWNEDITFIGNDYMSIRTVENIGDKEFERLGTYLIDLKGKEKRVLVPLSKLTDEESIDIEGAEDLKNRSIKDVNDFTNFAITRREGRWCFYILKESEHDLSYDELDFNDFSNKREVMLRVSKTIARHDGLFTSWQGIKNQVPSAIDGFSSPNEDIAIIKTRGTLYIYKIDGETLDISSEIPIRLNNNEEIIMAEWAIGEYVDYWGEEVSNILKKSN